MSASENRDRENEFAVEMQEQKQSFLAIDADIEKLRALLGKLLREFEQTPTVKHAAPDDQEMARMQRLHVNTCKAVAAMENLFQTRNTMVLADNATAAAIKAKLVVSQNKKITNIHFTNSDQDVEVVEISDDDDNDAQIVGQRAVS
jgi:hypothetical protein